MTLGPGARRVLSFTVKVPPGAAPRQYLAGITVEPSRLPRPVPVASWTKASASVVIIDQVSLGLAVTVGPLSKMRSLLAVRGVSLGRIGDTSRLSILVHDGGQEFEKANGAATCATGADRAKVPFVMNTVLPGENAALPVNLPRQLAKPTVACSIQFQYGHGQVTTWFGSVSSPSSPPTIEVHTGPGDYVTLPATGTPTWAFAVIIVGGLAVLASGTVIALLVRRRRQNV